MNDAIEKIIPYIVQTYCTVKEKGRVNELENGLRITLNRLANRIDRGYNIEIRVEPIKISDSKNSVVTDISADLAEHIATISNAAKTLEFMKVQGPSVLSLPDEHFTGKKAKPAAKNESSKKTNPKSKTSKKSPPSE